MNDAEKEHWFRLRKRDAVIGPIVWYPTSPMGVIVSIVMLSNFIIGFYLADKTYSTWGAIPAVSMFLSSFLIAGYAFLRKTDRGKS